MNRLARNRTVTLCSVVLGLAMAAGGAVPAAQAQSCPQRPATFEPADGEVLHIIGQYEKFMDSYIAGTGIEPGGFMYYQNIPEFKRFNLQRMVQYPNSVLQLGLDFKGGDSELVSVAAGGFDDQIDFLATQIKASGRPVFLRIGYEFDGKHNNWNPQKYVAAYRRIADRIRFNNVTNVAFVWHSYAAAPFGGHPISAWYPGDEYVDWAAVSLFWSAYYGSGLSYAHGVADFADAHGKPLMIAESTPAGNRTPSAGGHLWGTWYTPVIDFINARGVKAWSYINDNWEEVPWFAGKGWGDARVEAHPVLKAQWTAELNQPRYLKASPTLFCQGLGWPSTRAYTAVDQLEDFDYMLTHSADLVVDRYAPEQFGGDAARLKRNSKNEAATAVWRVPNLASVKATGYIWGGDAYRHFGFAASADGVRFSPVTPGVTNLGGSWPQVSYSMAVPAGTNFLRVTFPTGTANVWTPQLGQIAFTMTP